MYGGMAIRTTLLRRFLSRHASLALLVGISGSLAIIASACGAGGGNDDETSGSASTDGAGAGTGEGETLFTSGSGMGGSTGTGFEECATSADEATLIPLNMIIMFDRSGSMDADNKWVDSTAALKAFVQSPESAGLRVALRYFPDDGCNDSDCGFTGCSQPEVQAAELTSDPGPTDAHEQALVSSIDDANPDGSHTPIYPALGGATKWAADYLVANPTEKAIVIFVTDGEPNGCDEDTNNIAAIAGDAFNASGVYTYAVGLAGSAEGLMNEIALRGGTGQAIFIGAGGNAEQDLLNALQAIQGNQLSCSFAMPQSANGEEIDPAKVNVTYTPGDGGAPNTVGQVANAAACAAAGGWYYDNPAAPTTITLCDATCQAVQADDQGKIQIVVGCATEAAE